MQPFSSATRSAFPLIREALTRASYSLAGRQRFPTTDDLLASWPPLVGGKTGPYRGCRLVGGGRRVEAWCDRVWNRSRSRTREGRNDALRALLEFGLDRYRRVAVIDSNRVYGEADTEYGQARVELVASRTLLRTVREGVPLLERTVVADDGRAAGARGRAARTGRGLGG